MIAIIMSPFLLVKSPVTNDATSQGTIVAAVGRFSATHARPCEAGLGGLWPLQRFSRRVPCWTQHLCCIGDQILKTFEHASYFFCNYYV